MSTKFLSVLMFQLSITEEENSKDEFVIEDEKFIFQMNQSYEYIQNFKPDIIVYPEMCYSDINYEKLKEYSKKRLVIAGSYYENEVNYTVVFCDGKQVKVKKRYASGAEPMARITRYIEPNDFIKEYLNEHIFEIKGEKICILNCMEYYHVAYFIARNQEIAKDLFAIISPCSNSNVLAFEQETAAFHNHNEYIYSFVCNCISTYKGKPYSMGESYI